MLGLFASTTNIFWSCAQNLENVRTVPSTRACWLGTSASNCVAKHWSRRAQHIWAILRQVLITSRRQQRWRGCGRGKKERLSSSDRSVFFASWRRLLSAFVVWLSTWLEKYMTILRWQRWAEEQRRGGQFRRVQGFWRLPPQHDLVWRLRTPGCADQIQTQSGAHQKRMIRFVRHGVARREGLPRPVGVCSSSPPYTRFRCGSVTLCCSRCPVSVFSVRFCRPTWSWQCRIVSVSLSIFCIRYGLRTLGIIAGHGMFRCGACRGFCAGVCCHSELLSFVDIWVGVVLIII